MWSLLTVAALLSRSTGRRQDCSCWGKTVFKNGPSCGYCQRESWRFSGYWGAETLVSMQGKVPARGHPGAIKHVPLDAHHTTLYDSQCVRIPQGTPSLPSSGVIPWTDAGGERMFAGNLHLLLLTCFICKYVSLTATDGNDFPYGTLGEQLLSMEIKLYSVQLTLAELITSEKGQTTTGWLNRMGNRRREKITLRTLRVCWPLQTSNQAGIKLNYLKKLILKWYN